VKGVIYLKSSVLWGILLILVGIILVLNTFGVTNFDVGEMIAAYWPIIFIIWGLENIFKRKKIKSSLNLIGGVILLLLGIAIIGRNLGFYTFDFSIIWRLILPILLILIGINILKSGALSSKTNVAIMSGIEKKNKGWKLGNQGYLAFMGGIELDLEVAEIPEGETRLHLTSVMAGIDVRVPEDVHIICRNTSILGGIDFLKDGSGGIFSSREFEKKTDSRKTLVIHSFCFMGGIEIR